VAGVPEITPAELRMRPGGSDPALVVHVYGAEPPLARSVNEYAARTVASGNVLAKMLSCDDTMIEQDARADDPARSTTASVKSELPGWTGTPETKPLDPSRFRPGGNKPDAIVHA
jgi:hypothetical protein